MTIYGTYKETLFRNEYSGYTVFKLRLSEYVPELESLNVVCCGTLSFSHICLPLKLTGEIQEGKYTKYLFYATEIEPHIKDKKEAIEFLHSSCCKGVSEKLAQKIVEEVGEDLFSLPDNPNAYAILTSIDGIACRRAKSILDALSQAKHHQKLCEYLSRYGGTFITAEKLIMSYGSAAMTAITNNPYEAEKITGLPFLSCDAMAKDLGINESAENRVTALILNILNRDYASGNAYMTLDRLYKNVEYTSSRCSAFPGSKISVYQIIGLCDSLQEIVTEIKENEIRYYLRKSYEDEIKTAKNVKRLEKNKKQNELDVNKIVKICERELHIKYSEKQKECFNFLTSNGLKIITGGPGTGKSTVINGLTYAYRKLYPQNNIVMMAPTGRAAQRISEITGYGAGTIHRMLGICTYDENRLKAKYYADYPADMIVVDESSMIDNEMMSVLTDSIKSGCLLIMVGDIDQLPSIGAGSVLRDVIKSKVETVVLDVNYRQKGKSTIIDNAAAVNSGSSELISTEDFQVREFNKADTLVDEVKKCFLSLYDKKNPYSVQVLCPQNIGTAGVWTLNKSLQEAVRNGKKVMANKYSSFSVGDKVMATVNNYDNGYFNGDIGIITEVSDVTFTIDLCGRSLIISREDIDDFQLAYACTIHKSQGSEYDTIIICLTKEANSMIKRNLLYTAITRAKKRVFIYTQQGCIESAVERVTTDKRTSGLVEKIVA